MKMVSSVKLHRAESLIENMVPYQRQLDKILRSFLRGDLDIESPYVELRTVKRVALVLFSSNSSLCGAFNSNIIKTFLHLIGEYRKLGQDNILIYPIGRKIEDAVVKMGFKAEGSYQHLADKPSYEESTVLANHLMELFVSKDIDRVELIYHHHRSLTQQDVLRENFLPIDLAEIEKEEEKTEDDMKSIINDYIVEPSVEELISNLLPQVLYHKMYTALVDSYVSEQASRMIAMQNATDNANDLIQDLTKQYNKGRQQAITNELLDIIGGSMR